MSLKWLCAKELEPCRGSVEAAGFDFRASCDAVLWPLWIRALTGTGPNLIRTGVRWQAPRGTYMKIESRSGLVVNANVHAVAGVIDSDYRGEIVVALENRSMFPRRVRACERIAQGIVLQHCLLEPKLVDELGGSERGEGGFGSTGSD